MILLLFYPILTAAASDLTGQSTMNSNPPRSGSTGGVVASPRASLGRKETPPDPRRALMRERRAAEWDKMSVPERDAVIVLNAMCKVSYSC